MPSNPKDRPFVNAATGNAVVGAQFGDVNIATDNATVGFQAGSVNIAGDDGE